LEQVGPDRVGRVKKDPSAKFKKQAIARSEYGGSPIVEIRCLNRNKKPCSIPHNARKWQPTEKGTGLGEENERLNGHQFGEPPPPPKANLNPIAKKIPEREND